MCSFQGYQINRSAKKKKKEISELKRKLMNKNKQSKEEVVN